MGSLAAFEIAVAGTDSVLPRQQRIAIHPQAHATARKTPLAAGRFDHLVQAFSFGLATDAFRAGYHHQPDAFGYFAPSQQRGCLAQVRQAAIRTAPNEDHIYR